MSRSFVVVVELPAVSVVKLPVYVELDIPSVISVQTSATVIYTIHNRSDSLQDFDVIVESSDAFMFAGHRQVTVISCSQFNIHVVDFAVVKSPVITGATEVTLLFCWFLCDCDYPQMYR